MNADQVRELLDYDAESGELRHRAGVRKGQITGASKNGRGYALIRLQGKHYYAHRLIWLWAYGEWPARDIDHINLDKMDNRLANLRLATESQNVANQRCRNSAGFKGVWQQKSKRWSACIRKDWKQIHLGTFDTPEEAHAAYYKAAKAMFGEFARRE